MIMRQQHFSQFQTITWGSRSSFSPGQHIRRVQLIAAQMAIVPWQETNRYE